MVRNNTVRMRNGNNLGKSFFYLIPLYRSYQASFKHFESEEARFLRGMHDFDRLQRSCRNSSQKLLLFIFPTRKKFSISLFLKLVFGDKPQCGGVYAVPQSRRLRTITKNMT